MLNSLSNPKTQYYLDFKKWVLGENFFWNYNEKGGVSLQHLERTNANSSKTFDSNVPFYTRTFIRRPEIRAFPSIDPWVDPSEVDKVVTVVKEIFKHNNESFSTLLRLSINAVHPKSKVVTTIPHYDHRFSHTNFIIYLTDAGGSTFVDDEKFDPKEDDVILFKGEHYHNTPAENRRVILVATMI